MREDDTLKKLKFLGADLSNEMLKVGAISTFTEGTTLIREEQYLKQLPLVLSGLLKVVGHFDERELLLYYIQPQESCIMSFSSLLYNSPSRIKAVTEEPSTLLLLDADSVKKWISACWIIFVEEWK